MPDPLLVPKFPPRLPLPSSLWLERLRVLLSWFFDPDLPEELLELAERAPEFADRLDFVPSSSLDNEMGDADLFLELAEPVVDRDFDVVVLFVGFFVVDLVVAIFITWLYCE